MSSALKYIALAGGLLLLLTRKAKAAPGAPAGNATPGAPGSLLNVQNISATLPKRPDMQYQRRKLNQITKFIIHHSATTSGTPLAYAQYHIAENGWPGIGYHYVIQKDGTIYQTQPLDVVSYHTAGQNTSSIGICLTGNYDIQTPPAAQLAAATALLRDLARSFGKLPVYGHKDFSQKTCPGNNINISALRAAAYVSGVNDPMQEFRNRWYTINQPVGKALGYPDCCIQAFCDQPPESLRGMPTKADKRRFQAACINGRFTGFLPCEMHAEQILIGKIKLAELIRDRNPKFAPFPNLTKKQS